MARNLDPEPTSNDPRFTLTPAELVAALMAGHMAIDLGTYPDADSGVYARISKDRRDKTSVERQLEIDIAYAQQNGLSYVVFFDKGKSAYRRGVKRPDYDAALLAIRTRRIKRLISYKIDRLYRQVEELFEIIKIADGGRVPVTLIGVDDDDVFDLTTDKGCDQAIGRVLEAQRESRRISERVKTERRKAREKGIPGPGAPAFGWQDKYTHDDAQAEALREAYKLVLHGASLRSLTIRWNKAGMKTARGAQWAVGEVKSVLRNQRNVGRLVHSYEAFDDQGEKHTITEIVHENAFPPIVDLDTFDAVQRVLVERSSRRNHPPRRSALTGLVRCARCGGGAKMTRNQVDGGRPVFRCANAGTYHVGCGITIHALHLQRFVEDALFRYVDSAEFSERVEEREDTGSRRAELTMQLDRLNKRRAVLRKSMLADDYDDDLDGYQQDVRDLGQKIRRIEEELAMSRPVHPAYEWAGKGDALRGEWEEFDHDIKREIIKDAFDRITVSPATRKGSGFDPNRIEFGVGNGAH
jgi:site-specific DNA recombinase